MYSLAYRALRAVVHAEDMHCDSLCGLLKHRQVRPAGKYRRPEGGTGLART
jgi:hypothetical protein